MYIYSEPRRQLHNSGEHGIVPGEKRNDLKEKLLMRKPAVCIVVSVLCLFMLMNCFAEKNETGKTAYDYMVLVNKAHRLPDNWESNVVLKEAVNKWGETHLVEEKALEQFLKLQKECADEGIIIELDSTTRSVARQQELWDDWTIEKGEDYVKKYVAVPGYSEHHTGLAIDVCLEKDGRRIDDNDEMIAEKEIFAKVHEKLAKYGFILRYPDGKDAETGYSYELWHFRYIDNPEIAKEIMDKGSKRIEKSEWFRYHNLYNK